MARKQPADILCRLAVALLVAAVSMLPLLHTGEALAGTDGCDAVNEACTVDVCGCCDYAPDPQPCCPSDRTPDNTPDEELPTDSPCDCPCCGKVLTVAPMAPPYPVAGLFWDQTPTALLMTLQACPSSAAVRVAIQPPIA